MALQKPDGQESDATELLMDGYTVFGQLLKQSLVYLDGSGSEEACKLVINVNTNLQLHLHLIFHFIIIYVCIKTVSPLNNNHL